MCDCYTIGGPFIGADPDCPIHGEEAKVKDARTCELESRVRELEARLTAIERRLNVNRTE